MKFTNTTYGNTEKSVNHSSAESQNEVNKGQYLLTLFFKGGGHCPYRPDRCHFQKFVAGVKLTWC